MFVDHLINENQISEEDELKIPSASPISNIEDFQDNDYFGIDEDSIEAKNVKEVYELTSEKIKSILKITRTIEEKEINSLMKVLDLVERFRGFSINSAALTNFVYKRKP